MKTIPLPVSFKRFTTQFYDGVFEDHGEIEAIEYAVRTLSVDERHELLTFFSMLRETKSRRGFSNASGGGAIQRTASRGKQ